MGKFFKKLFKIITSKAMITFLCFIIQIALMVMAVLVLSSFSFWIYLVLSLFSIIVCLYIMSRDFNPGYKLAWIFPILIVPLFGGLLYLFFGRQTMKKKIKKSIIKTTDETQKLFEYTADKAHQPLNEENSVRISNYILNQGNYPVYGYSNSTYYEIGEKYYEALKIELLKAKKFIFMEFFIIEQGKMWNSILDILKQKVSEGVDIRLIYDAVGCMFTLPGGYHKKLNAMGIKTQVFNKLRPTFDVRLNNRTHRKIVVIDGNTSFTGGLNLADEYINEIVRFGHWKDTGIKIEGVATWSFTIMFLRFWLLLDQSVSDFNEFIPTDIPESAVGFIQPLSGGPGPNVQLIENVFMQMINLANKYLYISTPYLILDNETVTALTLAAKSGIDVRISMPHIPDKKTVFMMSRSFYPILLKAGVKIYEYTPGFIHAKEVITDDTIAFIGTCNMDYRSFYLHYECGAILYDTPSIGDMKTAYLETLEKCHQVTLEEANDVTVFTRIARSILRVFAPLL